MNTTTFILIIIAIVATIAAVVYFARKKRAKKRVAEVLAKLPIDLPETFPFAYTTPRGVGISSVAAIPEHLRAVVFNAIDEGIQYLLTATRARYPNWQNANSHGDYGIYFLEPTATNLDGSPALMINGIQSVGTVIGIANDGFPFPSLVLPHQAATDWRYLDYLMRSVWFEGEHLREHSNDLAVFYSYLGANDIHEHTPFNSAKSFVAEKQIKCGLQAKICL